MMIDKGEHWFDFEPNRIEQFLQVNNQNDVQSDFDF